MRITVNGDTISEVSSLKYLGARFNAEALCDEKIKTRLVLAREQMGKLDPYVGSFSLWYGSYSHRALRLGPYARI